MKRLALAILLVVAAIDISNAQVSMSPAERFALVQSLRGSGDLDAALEELEDLRADFPHDVDYSFARAQVLVQLGRDEEALAELAIAEELAPDYEDVRILKSRLLDRQQEAPAHWTMVLGAGHEDLSNGLPSWDNQFAELQLQQSPSRRYFARVARDARYTAADTSFGLGLENGWDSSWFAGAELGFASDPTYQPDLGYSVHAGKSLHHGWVADLRYRRKEYDSATVGSLTGTVEKYFGDYRIAYGLSWSRLHGGSYFNNHVLTLNWYHSDISSIGITINAGNEAEALGNGQVLETDVSGVTISGRRALTERLGLSWWLGTHEQGNFYRRRFLGVAASIRF